MAQASQSNPWFQRLTSELRACPPHSPPKEQHSCLLCQAPASCLPLPIEVQGQVLHKAWRSFWISALESTRIQRVCTSSLVRVVGSCFVVEMVAVLRHPTLHYGGSFLLQVGEDEPLLRIRAWPSKCALPSMASLLKITSSKILLPHKIQLGKKTLPHTHLNTEIAQHTPSEAEELTFK